MAKPKQVVSIKQPKSSKELTPFSGKVKANSDGYYKGKVIKEGQIFNLECNLVDGKFPLWVDMPTDFKFVKAEVEVEEEEVKIEVKSKKEIKFDNVI
jgi:hypothetical protein